MPQQWAWNFRYAGPDGMFNTKDDIVTFNELRVPAGHPVMLNLKAKDVIHSFYLPNFRLKQDANPGAITRSWFKALKTGNYEIACSQMCGWAHYKMKGDLIVLADADYARWMKEAEGDATPPLRRRGHTSRCGAGSGCSNGRHAPEPPLRRSRLPRRAAHPSRADELPPEVRLLDGPQGHREAVPLGRPRRSSRSAGRWR